MAAEGCQPSPPGRLPPEVFASADVGEPAPDTSESPAVSAEWRFNEGEGYVLTGCGDACIAELHGFPNPTDGWRTALKGSGWRADGTADGGWILMMDGDDDHVRVSGATIDLSAMDAFTIEARVRLRPGALGDASTILSYGAHDDPATLSLVVDDEGFLGATAFGCDGDNYLSAPDKKVPPDRWVSVAITVDHEAGAATIYLDGVPLSFCGQPVRPAPGGSLIIGAQLLHGVPVHGLCGDLDMVRLRDHALSGAEIMDAAIGPIAGEAAAVDAACTGGAGCADGSDEPSIGGDVVACRPGRALDGWGPSWDDACAAGWRVCTVQHLASLTSNSPLPLPSETHWALAQQGCGPGLGERWTTVAETCSAGPDGCPPASIAGPVVAAGTYAEHHCGDQVLACGVRACRPGQPGESVDGVLCCRESCPSESR